MSRKFLDDHIQLLDKLTRLPSSNSTAYDRGHTFRDSIDGTVYTNVGTREGAIYENFPANRYKLVETFQRNVAANASIGVAANLDFELLGTDAASGTAALSTGGGVSLTTDSDDGDQMIIAPHLDAGQTAWTTADWNTNDRVVYEATISTVGSVADMIVWVGLKLTNASAVATDDNQFFVRYEDSVNSGQFQVITSRAGTDTTTNTDLAMAINSNYHIVLVIDGDRIPHVFINGNKYASGLSALTANIDLIPYIGVETDTTAAKVLRVRGCAISKDYND